MNIIKLLIVLGIAGFAYQYWTKHHLGHATVVAASAGESRNGADEAGADASTDDSANDVGTVAAVSSPAQGGGDFVALPAVTGANANAVLVVAAENCPEEAAQRADRIAEELARSGIPVSRTHNVSFNIPNGDSSVAQRVMSVMNGELPIVIVHGRAKSNPSLEEVIAEYQGGRS